MRFLCLQILSRKKFYKPTNKEKMKSIIFLRELFVQAANEKGSLSLENVLFIGAVAGIATGVTAFYADINTYLTDVTVSASPTNLGATSN